MPSVPGGGSDHESFIFGLGIPTAKLAYGGRLAVYHSAYDDLAYARRIIDPGFRLHRDAARILGLVALRLVDASNVPYRFGGYAALFRSASAEIAKDDHIGRDGASARAFDAAGGATGARSRFLRRGRIRADVVSGDSHGSRHERSSRASRRDPYRRTDDRCDRSAPRAVTPGSCAAGAVACGEIGGYG